MVTPDMAEIRRRLQESIDLQKQLNARRRLAVEDFGEYEEGEPVSLEGEAE